MTSADSRATSVALSTEFNLYASSRPALREAVGGALDRFRAAQVAVMAAHLEQAGLAQDLPAIAATVVLASVLRGLALEAAIGVSQGHAETLAWLRAVLAARSL